LTVQTDPAISGHEDPAGEAPWAMQLVVRVEKSDPPSRTAVLEAAAMATVRLLADHRSQAEWKPAIDRWMAGRIRKHCRRARGAQWEALEALPGVTVDHAGAQVRAFVPTSIEAIYPQVAKLQLTGRDLDDPDDRPAVDAQSGVLVVSVSADPPLSWPKAAAAASHCSQIARMQMPAAKLSVWASAGFPVVVEHPDVFLWAERLECADVRVVDSGLTEVTPGQLTAVGRWA